MNHSIVTLHTHHEHGPADAHDHIKAAVEHLKAHGHTILHSHHIHADATMDKVQGQQIHD